MSKSDTTANSELIWLPEDYEVLSDGPGREVLARKGDDRGHVFPSVLDAVNYARYLEGFPKVKNV